MQSTLENDSDGFKDQIVAKERSHMYWMNYDQTFASMTKFDWIQTILYPLATAEDVEWSENCFSPWTARGFHHTRRNPKCSLGSWGASSEHQQNYILSLMNFYGEEVDMKIYWS